MLRNISSNWGLVVFRMALVFYLTPFTINILGESQYGAWVLIASATSYLQMLALGMPMATVQFLTRFSASGRQEELNRTAGSVAGMYLLIGLGTLLVGTVLFFVFDRVYDIPPAFRHEARIAFALVVLNIAMSFMGQLPYGMLAAHEDFVIRNRIQIGGLTLRLGLTVALLTAHASLVWLAVAQIATFLFEFSIATWVTRRRYPEIRVSLANFEWRMVREIFTFSMFALVLHVGGQLIFESSSLVIGGFLPLSDIAPFAVAASLAIYLTEFMRGIGQVMMPKATALHVQDRMRELRAVYLKWSKISLSLSFAACTFLLVLGPRFLAWWIQPDYETTAGPVLQILMLGFLLFLPARAVALPILMGLGNPRVASFTFLGTGLANVGLSVWLVRAYGLPGVAIGATIPNVVFALTVFWLAGRVLGVSPLEFVRHVVIRPVLGALPVLMVLVWFRDGFGVRTLPELLLAGIAGVAVGGVVALLFVYRNDPYLDLPRELSARLRRFRAA